MDSSNRGAFLLAVDGSDQSLAAVRYAGRFLPAQTTEMVLFHVADKVPDAFWDLGSEPLFSHQVNWVGAWENMQKSKVKEFMEKARQILIEAGIPQEAVKVRIRDRVKGISRDVIAESERGYRAVVVGSVGTSKLKDLVLGSVAAKLLSNFSHVALCVVAGDPEPGKILVAMDSSQGAGRAVKYVPKLVKDADCEVMLFHAVRGLSLSDQSREIPWDIEESEDLITKEAHSAMEPFFDEAKAYLVEAGLDEKQITSKIVTGAHSRAGAIMEQAEEEGFTTIVAGRRGVSEVGGFFIGRVSNKVMHLARGKAVWIIS
ncbi:MAG: universal stress protein [Thermodesulfobacteriota bacterium]|nr:universal stress protein [Thermodesulfobacteriota bacterium]